MLASLSEKDRKTIRYGAAFIGVYLCLFYGGTLLSALEGSRTEYFQQLEEAQRLGELFRTYETKVLKIEKLRHQFRLNVHALSSTNLVGNAGRTIQDLVKQSEFKMGQIRETLGGTGNGLAATFQLEAEGPLKSFMPLLDRLQSTGYPLIIESLTVLTDKRQRGKVQWSATITVLDYNEWKSKGGNRA